MGQVTGWLSAATLAKAQQLEFDPVIGPGVGDGSVGPVDEASTAEAISARLAA